MKTPMSAKFLQFLLLPLFVFLLNVGWGQTTVQSFGSGTGSHASQTGSATFISNPTSGTTYARAGAAAASATVNLATASNPLGTSGSYIRAVSSTSTSVTKVSPIVGYTSGLEFYSSFKVLFGNSTGGNTATSGVWTFYQGLQGTNYNDNNDVSNANVFTGLRFTFGASGALSLTYNNAGTYNSTSLTTSSFAQGTAYTIEIVGNNKSSGTISYSYNGTAQTVAIQKFDLYINGTLVGNDLTKGGATANTNINAVTFTGVSSSSNVANIFLDDVVVYNAVPSLIGATAPAVPTITGVTPGNAQLSVAFSAPSSDGGSAVTDYKYSTDGGTSFKSAGTTTSPFTITTVSGSAASLVNGTSYNVQIKAVNAVGDGTATSSTAATPRTTPSAPTISSITPGNQLLSVAFTAGSNGGSAITNYQYSTDGGTTFTACSPVQTSSPISISGLTNGTSYSVQIKAVNDAGSGTASASTSATPVAPSSPTLNPITLSTALTTTYGTSSTGVSFAVGGSNLSTTITATPQSGYEISLTLDGTYQSTAMTGIANGSTLYVRFASTKAAGSFNGVTAVVISGGGAASDANVTTSATGNSVSQKALSIDGLTAQNKIYDGLTTATVTGTAALVTSGIVNSDVVSLSGSGTFTFSSSAVGTSIAITTTGYSLTGTNAGNYTLTQPSLSADITARSLTITASNVSKFAGVALTGGAGSTAFTSSGLQNSESIGTVTIAYGTAGAATGDGNTVGLYVSQVTPSAATGGTFTASNYSISYVAGSITVTAAPVTLAAWDFSATSMLSSPPTPSTNSNVSIVNLSRGSGVITTGSTYTREWGGYGWPTGTTASSAISGNYFLTFSVKAAEGYSLSISSIPAYQFYSSTNGPRKGQWQYSLDNTTFTNIGSELSYPTNGTNSIAEIDLTSITSLQNVPSCTTVTFRILGYSAVSTSNGSYAFYDGTTSTATDFSIVGSLSAVSQTIAVTGSPTAFSTTYGTPSAVQNFTVLGSNIPTEIAVWAPSGYEISKDGSAYSTSLTFNQSSCNVNGTLNLRLSSTAPVTGQYNSKDITLSSVNLAGGTSATAYITTTSSGNLVNPKSLTIAPPIIASKSYDGTTTAGAVTPGALSGFVGSETLTATGIAAVYSSANVGTYNNVAVAYTLNNGTNGGVATNYSLASGTGTGAITAKVLTITTPTISSKTYDGTATAGVVTVGNLSGLVGSETVTATGTSAAYSSANVGTYSNVTVTYILANSTNGGLASNYSLASGTASGTVTAKPLSITPPTISSKTYDGTTTAGAITTGTLSGFVGSETVTAAGSAAAYSSATVGIYNNVIVTYSLTNGTNGGLASNYSLASGSATGSITKATPTIISQPSASAIIEGQTLNSSILSGGSANVDGSFSWTNSSISPATGTSSQSVTFTPTDITNYNTTTTTTSLTVNAQGTPTIFGSATAAAFSTVYGTASSIQNFEISGSDLNAEIIATAPSGFEVSSDGITFSSTAFFSSNSGLANGTLRIRIAASAPASGNYNNKSIVLESPGAISLNITTSASGNIVSPKALSITPALIAAKTYNASAATGTVTSGELSGLVGSETIVVSSATGSYSDANVGTGKTATITYILGNGANGGLASNYYLATTTATGNIIAKALSVTTPTVASKTYDGSSTSGVVTSGLLSGFVGTETVVISSSIGVYADANVGTGKTATITYLLGNGINGGLASNYSLATSSTTGNITAKSLLVSTATIASKTYDGSAISGTVTPGTLSGFIGSETVVISSATGVYSNAHVGTGKTAIVTYNLVDGINGGLASNYYLATSSTTGNIIAKSLSVSTATIASKAYDGLATSGIVTPGTLSGFIGSETVVISLATGVYSDANVGTGKAAIITYTLGSGTNGGLATNYSLANTTTTGEITQGVQTITFTSFTTPITANTTIVSSSNFGGTISYESSNTSVATINSSTGAVTTVGNGTTTITASNSGNSNYSAASVSQVLTVNSPSTSLIAFDFAGNTGDAATASSTSTSSGIASSTISRGSGLSASANADRFNATNWATGSIANAISGSNYMEFTITPNSGFQFSVSSVLFQIQRSASGLTAIALRSSLDNYSSNLDAEKSVTDNTSTQSFTFTFSQSNSSSAITYRLYGYSEAAAGSAGPGDGPGNDIVVYGSVSCTTPSQSSSITGPSAVCSGTSQTYSVTNVSGVGYTWSLPNGWASPSTTNSITVTAGSAGTISVTPYNSASGCTNYTSTPQSVSVIVNPIPTVNAGTAFTKTCVSNTNGAAIGETAEAGHTYSWTPSIGLSSSTASNPTANPTSTTAYTVTKTNTASGCSITGSVLVSVDNQAPTVTATPNQTVCAGTSVTLSGSGASTYSWNNSITNGVAFTPVSTTTYTVTGTDGNGCTNAATSTVTVNPMPTVVTLSAPAYCSNTTGTISTATSQTNVTYDLWTSGEAIPNTSTPGTGNALSWTLLSAGDYFVVATNANNCTATSATITLASFNQYSYFPDTDGDGFGAGTVLLSCSATTPANYSTLSTDCNDNNAAISPGTAEICGDGIDNNCDNNESYPSQYRSAVATGDWSDASTWEKYCNAGGSWTAAQIAPSNQYFNASVPFAVTVQSGHTITVSTTSTTGFAKAGSLSVVGNLIVNGKLTVTSSVINSGNVTINHGASFVQSSENTTNSGSGNFIVNMNLTGANNGTAPTGRYWYLGSPMNNTVASLFFDQPKMVRLWSYEPSNNSWVTLINSSTTASGATNSTLLATGMGYLYRAGVSKTITFTGDATAFNNNITTPLSFTGAGYKYVANPYTSHIDWRLVTRTGLNVSYWIRNTTNTAYEAYNATSGVSTPAGTQTTQFIPPMQGFWIYAFTASSSLRMDNGDRTHSTNGLHTPEHNQIVRLNLNDGKTDDQAVVYENENASNGIEEYDTDKFMDENHHQVYFLEGTKQLTLDGLKDATAKQKVDMGIQITAAGTYTINAVELGVEEDVVLEDKFTHTFQDLKRNSTYSFTANAGTFNNRFVLHFTLNPQTEIATESVAVTEEAAEVDGVSVYTTTGQQVKVWVTNTADFQNATVKVYDAIGNLVERKNMTSSELLLDLDTATGVYLVEVTGDSKVFTKKIFIAK